MERLATVRARVSGARVSGPSTVGAAGLTREQMIATLMPLAVALHREMDLPSWSIYWRAVQDIAPAVLDAAVTQAVHTGGRFFPTPAELMLLCAKARTALVAAVPFVACEVCERSPGWRSRLVDGVARLERCACWHAHRAQIQRLGVGHSVAVADLPAGSDE